jgi:acyl-CoA thioesterase II
MSEPRPPGEALAEMLVLKPAADGAFGACLESFWGSAVPGDLIARMLLAGAAAQREVPCAIQTSFLRPLAPDVGLTLACETLATARARVDVREGGALIATALLRFGPPPGPGLAYQSVAPEPGLPAPEQLPSETEVATREGWSQYAVGPIESRRITPYLPVQEHEPAVWLGWLRPRAPLGDDASLNAAALAFLSEYRSHWAVERRLGADFPSSELTLLDHALWIHRVQRWDDWWLVRTASEIGVGGRCLSRREMFSRAGALLASAVWEHTVRTRV